MPGMLLQGVDHESEGANVALERVRDQAPATPAIDLYSYSGTDIGSSDIGPGSTVLYAPWR